jgi:hypothetical protein
MSYMKRTDFIVKSLNIHKCHKWIHRVKFKIIVRSENVCKHNLTLSRSILVESNRFLVYLSNNLLLMEKQEAGET